MVLSTAEKEQQQEEWEAEKRSQGERVRTPPPPHPTPPGETRCSEMSHIATPHYEGRLKFRPALGKHVSINGEVGSSTQGVETGDWGQLAMAGEAHGEIVMWAGDSMGLTHVQLWCFTG